MHMADALISPAVGATMCIVSGFMLVKSAKKIRAEADDRKTPLMGILGAFIFAAQMINFTIPGTGSSGHLGGGLLLSILLGPNAAFLVMASILTVQALFFADGGLLALGCNIFNLGFMTCFLAYPLIYRPLVKTHQNLRRVMLASVLAGIVGLQLGATAVVLETVASGVVDLSIQSFATLMLPIHLGIGLVEGWVTFGVVAFIYRTRPELLENTQQEGLDKAQLKKCFLNFGLATVLVGCGLSWFASAHPDGLEWALEKTPLRHEAQNSGQLHETLSTLQDKTAIMPDYGFKNNKRTEATIVQQSEAAVIENISKPSVTSEASHSPTPSWPAIDPATSLAGLFGGALTLIIVALMGWILRRRQAFV